MNPHFFRTSSKIPRSKHEAKKTRMASPRLSWAFFSVSPWEWRSKTGQEARNHRSLFVIFTGILIRNSTIPLIRSPSLSDLPGEISKITLLGGHVKDLKYLLYLGSGLAILYSFPPTTMVFNSSDSPADAGPASYAFD